MTTTTRPPEPLMSDPPLRNPPLRNPTLQPAIDAGPRFDVAAVRARFPLLAAADRAGAKPLAYLDSAATSQKPDLVLAALDGFYRESYGAIARGVYALSAEATRLYEAARGKVARFLGAAAEEIVFTRGTTEAINLVAQSWGRTSLAPGDELLVTGLEHHSNLVPWQLVAEATGAKLVAAPIDGKGDVPLEEIEARLASGRVRMVAVAHVSNALGTLLPVPAIARLAHAAGALVLVDGAQSAPRLPVDVAALGCDFFAFSGHKAYAPNGIGVLWGRGDLLAAMPPYQGGGGMIREVTLERTTFADPPQRFEAGTPVGPEAHALGVALDWIDALDRVEVAEHEARLVERAARELAELDGVRLIGAPCERVGIVSFVVEGTHAHDVGTVLDAENVAVRVGHHCAQPAMASFGVPATVRASFGVYSTDGEVDRLLQATRRAVELLAR
jgi:cysteine desulfurase/selenocysteine lyase